MEQGGVGEGSGLERVSEGEAVRCDGAVDGEREASRPLERQGGTCRGKLVNSIAHSIRECVDI